MTSAFGFGRSPFEEFDDLFARFFGTGPVSGQRRPRQVDIGSLLSERARELVLRARGVAAADRSEELDARHLLAAALQVDTTRRMLGEAGVDVERLSQRLGAGATLTADAAQTAAVELSPSAKRALLDAYQLSRQLGTSYIGPEHILQALASNAESSAGRALAEAAGGRRQAAGGRQTFLAAPAAHSPEQPRRPSRTPTLDEFGRNLTEQARAGKLDPVPRTCATRSSRPSGNWPPPKARRRTSGSRR
jgi:ATP-dependent Clp protease ATP-binding subunit ClpC